MLGATAYTSHPPRCARRCPPRALQSSARPRWAESARRVAAPAVRRHTTLSSSSLRAANQRCLPTRRRGSRWPCAIPTPVHTMLHVACACACACCMCMCMYMLHVHVHVHVHARLLGCLPVVIVVRPSLLYHYPRRHYERPTPCMPLGAIRAPSARASSARCDAASKCYPLTCYPRDGTTY